MGVSCEKYFRRSSDSNYRGVSCRAGCSTIFRAVWAAIGSHHGGEAMVTSMLKRDSGAVPWYKWGRNASSEGTHPHPSPMSSTQDDNPVPSDNEDNGPPPNTDQDSGRSEIE